VVNQKIVFYCFNQALPHDKPIHGEPEYLEIMEKMEEKYPAEHNRVRKWLEETGRMEQFNLEP